MILKKSVITRLLLIITLLCSIIHTKLTIEQIKEVVKNKDISASSIINPIFGWLFESTGCLENLRFYSPSLEYGIDKNGKRVYAKDTSIDPFIRSVIALFPSPAGVLCRMHNIDDSCARRFDKSEDKEMNIKFLAQLFIVLVNDKKESEQLIQTLDEKNNKLADCLKLLAINLLKNDNMSYPDSEKQLKPLLLHAFIINSFDKSEDLSKYLDLISVVKNVEIQDFNCKLFEMVGKARDSLNFFPYSKLNQPLSNDSIPVYNRKENKFDDNNFFSDCVDVMLLHLCNCLFYDGEKYSVDHLKEDAPIRKFYENKMTFRPFTLTLDIRKEWSKVIQDLPELENKDNSIYKPDLIIYNKLGTNEVDTGIINMMSVLARICSIDTKKLWRGLNDSNLGGRLEWLLKQMLAPGCTMEVKIQPFTRYNPKGNQRKDFVGNFTITFKRSSNKATVLVHQSNMHASLKFVSGECPAKEELDIPESLINMSEDDVKTALFKRYMLLAKEIEMPSEKYNDTALFNMIFISGPLSSDNDKGIILDKIYGMLAREEDESIKKQNELLENICEKIFNSVNLEDEGTKILFSPFFFYFPKLIGKNMKLIDYWKRAIEYKYWNVFKSWDGVLVKEEKTRLDLSRNNIGPDGAKHIAWSLGDLKNLQYLDLKWNKIGPDGAKDIVESLKKMKNLTTLNLSGNNIGDAGAEHIADSLKELVNLQYLYLSYNNLGPDGARDIVESLKKMKNLKNLDLSSNNIGDAGAEDIAKSLMEMKKLEYLNLS